jgi:hypothetical protein
MSERAEHSGRFIAGEGREPGDPVMVQRGRKTVVLAVPGDITELSPEPRRTERDLCTRSVGSIRRVVQSLNGCRGA